MGCGSASLRIRVAGAAAERRPRDAIRLYMEQVERLIAARGRGNYATAASYLVQVRDLYQRLGEPVAWQELITSLRERHRRLPAPCPFRHNRHCAVYPRRPTACRAYPYLDQLDFRARTLAMLDRVAQCPVVFNVWKELEAEVDWR